MTDPCGLSGCHEPREHGTPYCPSHWSLVPRKLQTQFQFVLGRMLKNVGSPRGEAAARDLHSLRLSVQEAIKDAIEEHKKL